MSDQRAEISSRLVGLVHDVDGQDVRVEVGSVGGKPVAIVAGRPLDSIAALGLAALVSETQRIVAGITKGLREERKL